MPQMPVWYHRLRGKIDRCTRWHEVKPILREASAWEAVAKYRQDADAEALAVSLQRDADQRAADLHGVLMLRDWFAWRALPRADDGDGDHGNGDHGDGAHGDGAHGNGAPVCYTMRVVAKDWPAVEVARLSCVDGAWQARLDQHRPWTARSVRDCTSAAAGRLGVELWAARHFARLQTEVRAALTARPARTGTRPAALASLTGAE